MEESEAQRLGAAYVAAWSTEEDSDRARLVGEVYAEDAVFWAAEAGDDAVVCRGRGEIIANIAQVNRRLTQGAGLTTELSGVVLNHDLLRVTWRMVTPTGEVAMTGMNVLDLDAGGLICRDHIFIG